MSRRRSLLLPAFLLTLLHAYVGWRILPDLPAVLELRIVAAVLLAVSCGLMVLMVSAFASGKLPDRIAAAALFMAGFFSSLFVLTLLRDLVLLLAWLPLSAEQMLQLKSGSALLLVGLAVVATAVGFANARRRARVRRVDV